MEMYILTVKAIVLPHKILGTYIHWPLLRFLCHFGNEQNSVHLKVSHCGWTYMHWNVKCSSL